MQGSKTARRWGRRPRSGVRRAGIPSGVVLLLIGALAPFLVAGCASTPGYLLLDADGLYELGVTSYEDEDWDTAIAVFDRLLFAHPGDARHPEARMYLARAHFTKREYITSAAEFERFLQQYPNHGLAPEASIGICRSYERLSPQPQRDQGFTERAVDACRNTINEFPGMNVAEEARELQRRMIERLAQREYEEGYWYERRGLHDQAIIIYQDLIDYFPQTTWAPKGFLGLYRSYTAINWETEAAQARARLLANYPDSPEARELREPADARGNSGGNERDEGVSGFGR